ncbi:hypothetical protein [Photobacterium rosenbergii]|uniref:hypothetical protein n=1 Tax=Photobacterium rosenbergii TaxID=294936 RepID=UPI001C99C950|nr:hypothetical protein [Photobacterium rosenbergii]MBY5948458.1 hypothetical protein [Photobacterium rosenbergii]
MNKVLPLAALIALALTGCGGGNSDNPQQPVSELIRGTAASGAPIRGEVTVLDADGDTHTYLATDAGKFEFKRAELALPAIVKATGAAGGGSHEIYSLILEDKNITNITPLTQLLISRVSGVTASEVFDNFEQYKPALTPNALQEAQVELKSVLAPLLTAADIEESFDLLNTEFEANYTSIDAVLDLIDIAWGDTSANISYKGNGYAAELKFDENWSNEKLSNSDGELTVKHIGNFIC